MDNRADSKVVAKENEFRRPFVQCLECLGSIHWLLDRGTKALKPLVLLCIILVNECDRILQPGLKCGSTFLADDERLLPTRNNIVQGFRWRIAFAILGHLAIEMLRKPKKIALNVLICLSGG